MVKCGRFIPCSNVSKIGIYLDRSYFCLAIKDSEVKRYSTSVRIDKSSPELGTADDPDYTVLDAIDKLDPKAEVNGNWKIFHNSDDHRQLMYCVGSCYYTAGALVRTVFKFVRQQYPSVSEIRITFGFPVTEQQENDLKEIAAKEGFSMTSVANSLIIGILSRKQLIAAKVIVVDLEVNKCSTSVYSSTYAADSGLSKLAESTNEQLKGEHVRQAQRAWLQRNQNTAYHPPKMNESESEKIIDSDYVVDKVTEDMLEQLRCELVKVTAAANLHPNHVNCVFFLGLCKLVPLLNNLCCWMFPKAELLTVADKLEMEDSMAFGAIESSISVVANVDVSTDESDYENKVLA